MARIAGWYPDPHSPGMARYWDGARWVTGEIAVAEDVLGCDCGVIAATVPRSRP